jgi:hypothetical protein
VSTDVLLVLVVAELGVIAAQQRRLLKLLPDVITTNTKLGVWLAKLLGHFNLSTDIEPPRPPPRTAAGELDAR